MPSGSGRSAAIFVIALAFLTPVRASAQEQPAGEKAPQSEAPPADAPDKEAPDKEAPDKEASDKRAPDKEAPPEAAPPGNEDLARAKSQMENLQLEQALASLQAALERGGSDVATLVQIFRLRGEAAVGTGDVEAAREAFRLLLCLKPDYVLDQLVSPKIRTEFEAAKKSLAGHSLDVSHEVVTEGSPAIALIISDDPEKLVAGAEVSYRGASAPISVKRTAGSERVQIPVPAGAKKVTLRALDAHGNLLRVFEIGDLAGAAGPAGGGVPAVTAKAPAPGPPIYKRWWLWTGVVGALSATGVVFGLASRSAENDLDDVVGDSGNHYYSDVKAIRSRGRRDALLANLSFGAALVAAGVGGYLVWTGLGEEGEGRLEVSPAVGPQGAGVTLGGSF